jgi:DNA transposition AAA+ family ATPase
MQLVRPTVPDRSLFAEIGSVQRIRAGIDYARTFGWPTRIVSKAGYGKTTALYYLAQELGGSYCQAGYAHKTVPDMYRMLLAALGMRSSKSYTRDLFDELIWQLRRSSSYEGPRELIIVDEAQTLEATAQRELLNIQETCDLALVISGNGERIAGTRIDRAAWEQIDSRIGMNIALPGLTREDCQLIGSAYGVEGMDAYEAIANFGTQTTVRILGQLLDNAKRLTRTGGAIQLQHIQTVLSGNPKLGSLELLKPEAA